MFTISEKPDKKRPVFQATYRLGIHSIPVLIAMLLMSSAYAQGAATNINEATQHAINTNPEVQARWHEFLASTEAQDVARGGFLPQVDVSAGYGRERQNFRNNQRPDQTYNRRGLTLTLNQMIYDGFATRNEVDRLGYRSRASYYELLDSAEQTSFEAYRAYADVQRFRELVELANDNLNKHKDVFALIQKRVKSGVGRSVDLEQVSGRLALAESNVLTETSNLHDVSARYQRVIGSPPPSVLAPIRMVQDTLPTSMDDAMYRAYRSNPAHLSTIENIRAAERDVDVRRASMHPRLDFRVRGDYGEDIDQIQGDSSDYVAELVLSYNLYRGGADEAAIREFSERMNFAYDLKDKSCRDVRQTLAIAFNDVQRIQEQLRFLDRHQLAISKAREAYRDQFDIGQRSLLDLLDTENEYFEARRAYSQAGYDLLIAKAKTLASMGELMTALQVSRTGLPNLPDMDHSGEAKADKAACRI